MQFENLIKYFLLIGFAIVALIYNPAATEPFLLYKELAFRLLVMTAAFFFVLRSLKNKRFFAFQSKVVKSCFVLWGFCLYTFISYQVATNPFEVVQEQIRLIYMIAFFMMISSCHWKRRDIIFLFCVVSFAGVIVAALGILEAFYIFPLYGIKERILSLFGYPNLVAQFLLVALVMQIGLFFVLERSISRFLNGFCFLVCIACLFLTYCRSAWLSFILVSSGFIFYCVKRKFIEFRHLKFPFFLVCLSFIIFILLFLRDHQLKKNWAIAERHQLEEASLKHVNQEQEKKSHISDNHLPIDTRAWTLTKFSKMTRRGDSQRFQLWSTTLKMIRAHPLFGVGAGNYFIQYPRYSNGDDKLEFVQFAHNDFLHLLAEFGLLGFFLLAYWFWLITHRGFEIVRLSFISCDALLFISLLSVTFALAIDAFFSYDWYLTVPAGFLWLIWGIFQSRYFASHIENESPANLKSKFSKLIIAIFFCVFILFGLEDVVREAKAHLAFGRSHREYGAEKLNLAKQELEVAVKLKPHTARYRYVLANIQLQLGDYDQALKSFQIVQELTPYEFITNFFTALTLKIIGRHEEAVLGFQLLAKKYQKDTDLKRLYLHSLNEYGNILLKEGRHQEAIKQYHKILNEDGRLSAVYYNLGNVYAETGQFDLALSSYRNSYQIDPKQFLNVFQLALTLQKLDRKEEALRFYQEAILLDLNNYQPYLNLGVLIYDENRKKAVEYLGKSLELNPNQPQKDLVWKAIQKK